MALETVTRFSDGGVPTEAEMNELLDALKVLLNSSGLPATAFPWPLIAQGNIDMNGFDILNVTDVGGVINVNSSKSLSSAIDAANAGGDTKIIIDPGFRATVTTAGLAVTGDNITIEGSAGAQIDCVNQAVERDCITVTGNGFRVSGVEFISTGDGTNVADAVFIKGAEDARFNNNVFSGCHGGIRIGQDGATRSGKISVTHNIFDTQPDGCIVVDGGDDITISNNIGLFLQTSKGLVHIDGLTATSLARISITGNSAHGNIVDGDGFKIIGATGVIEQVVFTGNSSSVAGVALFVDKVTTCTVSGNNLTTTGGSVTVFDTIDSTVCDNVFTGFVSLSDDGGTFSNNVVAGNMIFNNLTGSKVSNNVFKSLVVHAGTITDFRCDGNQFSNAFALPNTGYATFLNNSCDGAITNLLNAGYGVDKTTYANNVSLIGEVT